MLFRVWILLIALSIAACQPDPVQDVQDGAAKLIVRKPESHNTELQALVIGTLLIEEGCIFIGRAEAETATAIWKDGVTLGRDSQGLLVRDHSGNRFHFGRSVRFGGGYISSLEDKFVKERIVGGSLQNCGAPYVLID